jgi:outer membrane protein assembly factor BamB
MRKILTTLILLTITACSSSDEEILKGERRSALPSLPSESMKLRSRENADITSAYKNSECDQESCYKNNNMTHLFKSFPRKEIWSKDIGKGNTDESVILAQPIIDGGRIFAMDSAAKVSALNLETGKRIWSKDLKENSKSPELEEIQTLKSGKIAYSENMIIAGTGFGDAVALNAKTGKEIWRRSLKSAIRSAPAVDDDHAYFKTNDNRIYALNKFNGSIKWSNAALPSEISLLFGSKPAVASNYVISAFNSGEVQMIKKSTGEFAWNKIIKGKKQFASISHFDAITASPIILDEKILITANSSKTVLLNTRNGDEIWDSSFGSMYTPVASGNAFFMLTDNKTIAAISLIDGLKIWETIIPKALEVNGSKIDIEQIHPPLLLSNRVVVFTDQLELHFDVLTGSLKYKAKTNFEPALTPVVAKDIMAVVTTNGKLKVFK